MLCKSCGKEIPEDAVFCQYCTVKIENEEVQTCKNCGADLPEGAIYCPYCTVKVENEKEDDSETFEQESTVSTVESTADVNEETLNASASGEVSTEMPKTKSKKKIFIVVAVSCLALILCIGGYYIYSNSIFSPLKVISKTVEAAKDISVLDLVEFKADNATKYTLDVEKSDFKSNVPGRYTVTYALTNISTGEKSSATFKFQVKDTTPPVITIKDTVISFLNNEFNALNYASITDNAADLDVSKLIVEGKIDTAVAATYPITVSIADASGNKTTKNVNVVVREITDEEKSQFLEKIQGMWINDTWIVRFDIIDNKYRIVYNTFTFDDSATIGYLNFVNLSNDLTKATLTWNWEYYLVSVVPVSTGNATVTIDTGIHGDNKIYVDLGNEKGNIEYQYITQEQLNEIYINYYHNRQ